MGPQGLRGLPGIQGPQGPPGPRGADATTPVISGAVYIRWGRSVCPTSADVVYSGKYISILAASYSHELFYQLPLCAWEGAG